MEKAVKDNEIAKKIAEFSYEESMEELEKICRNLQSGNLNLEEAVEAFELGTKLRKHAKSKLISAKMAIQMVENQEDSNGFDENNDLKALDQINDAFVNSVCESYKNRDLASIHGAMKVYIQKIEEMFAEKIAR